MTSLQFHLLKAGLAYAVIIVGWYLGALEGILGFNQIA